MVKDLMARAKTHTGLSVVVNIVDKVYQTDRKVAADFKQTMEIVFDEHLSQWNYTAKPQGG
jgi:Rhodopirellula transposase DDE domain